MWPETAQGSSRAAWWTSVEQTGCRPHCESDPGIKLRRSELAIVTAAETECGKETPGASRAEEGRPRSRYGMKGGDRK